MSFAKQDERYYRLVELVTNMFGALCNQAKIRRLTNVENLMLQIAAGFLTEIECPDAVV